MKSFSDLFTEKYSTQRDQWEKALKSELKIEEVSSKIAKKHLDLGLWPVLSLEAAVKHQIPTQSSWKKASQTYIHVCPDNFAKRFQEDLDGGTRAFFFYKDFLNEASWEILVEVLRNFEHTKEVEVFLVGQKIASGFKGFAVVDESQSVCARSIHEQGGHNVLELAALTLDFINKIATNPSHAFVFLDSHFFKNIAKVRALKLLLQKVAKESGVADIPKIVTLNSYRDWTLYERYSNILRNNVQVASGLVGGAEVIQSSGYQVIFNLETSERSGEHDERSERMARNTSHILSLESMLGLVEDASFGSYHIEELSEQYAQAAWKLMQVLLSYDEAQRVEFMNIEIQKVREERTSRFQNRKDILTGINEFPDAHEKLGVTLSASHTFRVAREFEEMRLKVEKIKDKPKVIIFINGELAKLNNRVSFIKNYFELIGLEVVEQGDKNLDIENKVIVLCSSDEEYPDFSKKYLNEKAVAKYVAGKVEINGFESIYSGKNVFKTLSDLTQKMLDKK